MKNEFNISNGNLEVLKFIPEMMTKDIWREKVRMLVIDYMTQKSSDNKTKVKK